MKQESGDGHEELRERMRSWGGDRARVTAIHIDAEEIEHPTSSEYRHPYLRPADMRMLEECELPSDTLEWIGETLYRKVICAPLCGGAGGGICVAERERAKLACKGIRVLLRARALVDISLQLGEAQLQHEDEIRSAGLNRTDARA